MQYKTKEEQVQLLQKVLTASDIDADEERIPGESFRPVRERNCTVMCSIYSFYFTNMHISTYRQCAKLETWRPCLELTMQFITNIKELLAHLREANIRYSKSSEAEMLRILILLLSL